MYAGNPNTCTPTCCWCLWIVKLQTWREWGGAMGLFHKQAGLRVPFRYLFRGLLFLDHRNVCFLRGPCNNVFEEEGARSGA